MKPKKLYLVLDGPKGIEEKETCNQTKKVLDDINWDCKVEKLFSDHNLGLKKRFKSGLDTIFNQEESLIILEDDTLPTSSFFRFCDELIEKYSDQKNIAQINGYNYLSKINKEKSYYFSTYPELWGWASWSDRWFKYYNNDLDGWNEIKNTQAFKEKFFSEQEYAYFYKAYENAFNNVIDSWDFKWSFSLRINELLSVAPTKNLVKNLGFGHQGATHTHQKLKYLSVTKNKQYNIRFPIKHPQKVEINNTLIKKEFDKKQLENSKLSKIIYNFKKIKKFFI